VRNAKTFFFYNYDISLRDNFGPLESEVLLRAENGIPEPSTCTNCEHIQRWMRLLALKKKIGINIYQTVILILIGPSLLSGILSIFWQPRTSFVSYLVMFGIFLLPWIFCILFLVARMLISKSNDVFKGIGMSSLNPFYGEPDDWILLSISIIIYLLTTIVASVIGSIPAWMSDSSSIVAGAFFGGLIVSIGFSILALFGISE
jgi:hypothetical protein